MPTRFPQVRGPPGLQSHPVMTDDGTARGRWFDDPLRLWKRLRVSAATRSQEGRSSRNLQSVLVSSEAAVQSLCRQPEANGHHARFRQLFGSMMTAFDATLSLCAFRCKRPPIPTGKRPLIPIQNGHFFSGPILRARCSPLGDRLMSFSLCLVNVGRAVFVRLDLSH